jgi:hypothetical protein
MEVIKRLGEEAQEVGEEKLAYTSINGAMW